MFVSSRSFCCSIRGMECLAKKLSSGPEEAYLLCLGFCYWWFVTPREEVAALCFLRRWGYVKNYCKDWVGLFQGILNEFDVDVGYWLDFCVFIHESRYFLRVCRGKLFRIDFLHYSLGYMDSKCDWV